MNNTLPSHDPFIKRLIAAQIERTDKPELVRLKYAGIPRLHRWASVEAMQDSTDDKDLRIIDRFVSHVLALDDQDKSDDSLFEGVLKKSAPKTSKRGMVLTGPPGTGKTSLAVAVLREGCKRTGGERPCRFIEFSPLIEKIKAGFGEEAPAIDLEGIARGNDFIVLDDLGQVRSTEWVSSQYYSLINALYVHRCTVIITTYIPLGEFESILSPAVRSRIGGMCEYIPLTGKDRRLEKTTG